MRCDKCRKKFTSFDQYYPKYRILEAVDRLREDSIFLCEDCSKDLSKWLDIGKPVKPEKEVK